jgi:hypothetical protein
MKIEYATCHPDRNNYGRGLCEPCYRLDWQRANPDKCAEYNRKWQKANRKKANAYKYAWAKANRAKMLGIVRE